MPIIHWYVGCIITFLEVIKHAELKCSQSEMKLETLKMLVFLSMWCVCTCLVYLYIHAWCQMKDPREMSRIFGSTFYTKEMLVSSHEWSTNWWPYKSWSGMLQRLNNFPSGCWQKKFSSIQNIDPDWSYIIYGYMIYVPFWKSSQTP